MAVETKLVTAEELLLLPDKGLRRELVDGEVRTMSPAGGEHGAISGAIHAELGHFLHQQRVAITLGADPGFVLRRNPDTVRAPDIAVLRIERIPPGGLPRSYIPGAPDLAVEVVSPNDTAMEVVEKVGEWLSGGAALVWVVYPVGPRLVVHRPDGSAQTLGPEDEVDGGEVLPGFRMRVKDVLNPSRADASSTPAAAAQVCSSSSHF